MDDKYLKLIETLAAKLGTTAEHLWEVLIRQAAISGTVDLVLCVGLISLSAGLISLVKRKTAAPEPTKQDKYPHAAWDEEVAVAGWIAAFAVTLVAFFFTLGNASDIVTAFANPEYWALRQLTN